MTCVTARHNNGHLPSLTEAGPPPHPAAPISLTGGGGCVGGRGPDATALRWEARLLIKVGSAVIVIICPEDSTWSTGRSKGYE